MLSVPDTPAVAASPVRVASLHTPLLAALRIQHNGAQADADIVRVPNADSYGIIYQLKDFPLHRLWVNRKLVYSGGHARHTMALTDLRNEYACQALSGFDNVKLQIGRDTLNELSDELFIRPPSSLALNRGIEDPTMRPLIQALLPSLAKRERGDELFIDHLTLAIAAHLVRRYGQAGTIPDTQASHGKLTKIQLACANEFIRAHLGHPFSLSDIARYCGMSRATFARSFKQTTGMTPFAWVRDRRVEHAKRLLSRPGLTISEISNECGFSDQSHLSRVFTQAVGVSPSVWRAGKGK
jgi:AraC family transcriptional regulator